MSDIYLAARYARREELLGYKADLEALGHHVTSRWLLGAHQWDGALEAAEAYEAGRPTPDAVRFAIEDVEDLLAASVCISFTEAPRETFSRVDIDDILNTLTEQLRVALLPVPDAYVIRLRRLLNESAGKASRGGRHVEFGMAFARYLHNIVVGPRENVFHLLPAVKVFDTWDDALHADPSPFGPPHTTVTRRQVGRVEW